MYAVLFGVAGILTIPAFEIAANALNTALPFSDGGGGCGGGGCGGCGGCG